MENKGTLGSQIQSRVHDLLSSLPFLLLVSILWILIVDPIRRLFTPSTLRFNKLKALELDALCDELIEGGDFDRSDREDGMTEAELRRIAGHISEKAVGAKRYLNQYPQLDVIFGKQLFWIYRNGYTQAQAENGIRIGFYLALLIIIPLWVFL